MIAPNGPFGSGSTVEDLATARPSQATGTLTPASAPCRLLRCCALGATTTTLVGEMLALRRDGRSGVLLVATEGAPTSICYVGGKMVL
jgi:hypothetical protein